MGNNISYTLSKWTAERQKKRLQESREITRIIIAKWAFDPIDRDLIFDTLKDNQHLDGSRQLILLNGWEYGGRMSHFYNDLHFNGIVLCVSHQSQESFTEAIHNFATIRPFPKGFNEIPMLVLVEHEQTEVVKAAYMLDQVNRVFPERKNWKLATFRKGDLNSVMQDFQWLMDTVSA